MNRPEKQFSDRRINASGYGYDFATERDRGYNTACDNWERFLPTKKELLQIFIEENNKGNFVPYKLAEAISKRLELKEKSDE